MLTHGQHVDWRWLHAQEAPVWYPSVRLVRCPDGGADWRGAAARVRLARAGSCLTYGYVDRPAAPGQPSCRELARKLRRARVTA